MFEQIISRDNPKIKQYLKLRDQKKHRLQEGLFVIESYKLLQEAIDANWEMISIFGTEQGLQKLSLPSDSTVRVYEVSDSIEQKLTATANSGGVFAVLKRPDKGSGFEGIGSGRYLYLCGLQDSGNVGTVIRTALALGISGVIVSGDCCDIYSLKVLRASMGGVFHLPIFQGGDSLEDLKILGNSLHRYAAVVDETAVDATTVQLWDNSMIVIGNEGNGLPQAVVDLCDTAITIRMKGKAESLNAGMAAGILMWEQMKGM